MLAASAVAFALEPLSDALWDEVTPLLVKHWSEVAHYDDIPLEPNRPLYQQLQDNGSLRIYTARTAAGLLIGYLCVVIGPNLHYASCLMAQQDVLYVDPAHRGSRTGVDLIRYAHGLLANEGVRVLRQHVKARADLNVGPVLTRLLGYELIDEIYGVRLDRPRKA